MCVVWARAAEAQEASMYLGKGREVAERTIWKCSCRGVSGDGCLQPRAVSTAVLVVKTVILLMVRAAVPLLAYCWFLQLPCAAVEAPQYVCFERGNGGVWVTWPLGNDAEQYQRCFLGDGTGENKTLGEAGR